MIPKIIHYCWFGGKKLPQRAKKYISSWKKFNPDYKIIEWNEKNFDITSCKYVYEAYQAKKFAFVTDYVRLFVLYTYGGIYMDTDVEVTKSLDCLLNYPAFSGFERNDKIPTGTMGAEKGNKWIETLLKDYDERPFIKENGQLDLTTNVELITNTTIANYSLRLDNTEQHLKDFSIFPFDWLCAKDLLDGKIKMTKNTYTIHHFAGSWEKKSNKFRGKVYKFLNRYFGKKCADFVKSIFGKKGKKDEC